MRKIIAIVQLLSTPVAAAAGESFQTYDYGNGDSSTYGSNGSSYNTYNYGNGDYGTYGTDSNGNSVHCQTYSYGSAGSSTYCN